jgi:hypothetical protein
VCFTTERLIGQVKEDESAYVLLDKYRDWLNRCSVVEFSFTETHTSQNLIDEVVAEPSTTSFGTVKFDKNNKCFFVDFNETTLSGIPLQTQTLSSGDGEFISACRYFAENKDVPDDYEIISYLDASKNTYSFESSLTGYSGNSMMIFGIYSLGKSGYILHRIDESLKGMILNAEQQQWQGHMVHRIIGSNAKDRYELWLDPTLGFMPVRISYFCDPKIDRTKPEYFSFDLCVESNHRVGNVFVPEKYVINIDGSHQWYEKKVIRSIPAKETYQGEISKVSFPLSFSDNDIKITMPIPNYTSVSMQDVLQIDYVWMDGKIVPLTDELAISRIRGHSFMPGVRESRFWMMIFGIILLVLAIIGQIWKYLKKSKYKQKE